MDKKTKMKEKKASGIWKKVLGTGGVVWICPEGRSA